MKTIYDRRKLIEEKLRYHDAKRKLIEAKLVALQHECPHTNSETWHDSGWGRMPSDEWRCKDCGLEKST